MRISPSTFVSMHDALVVLGGLVERIAPEREPGAVDEDVETVELLHRLGDEGFAARPGR